MKVFGDKEKINFFLNKIIILNKKKNFAWILNNQPKLLSKSYSEKQVYYYNLLFFLGSRGGIT
jgi:hypothetical protein